MLCNSFVNKLFPWKFTIKPSSLLLTSKPIQIGLHWGLKEAALQLRS